RKLLSRNKEIRESYELILAFVHVISSGCYALVRPNNVLETLKTDTLKDFDEKKEIGGIIRTLAPEGFALLINLGKEKQFTKLEILCTHRQGQWGDELGAAIVFVEAEGDEDEYGKFEVEWAEEDDEAGVGAGTTGILGMERVKIKHFYQK